MLVRRERAGDVAAIRALMLAAFAGEDGAEPVEAGLVEDLRADVGWLPGLALVVELEGAVVGHVVCTRGFVGEAAALGLGPIGVLPGLQRRGVGSALMHAALGAADALGEPLVALLGDPGFYTRFGFRAAAELNICPPVAAWAPHFQVRTLTAYAPGTAGTFNYAGPFARFM